MILSKPVPIFISAGDPSGDIAGSLLLGELSKRNAELSFMGLGGKRMRRMGQEQMVDGSELAVLGFWEVARKFSFFRKLLNQTVRLIEEKRPKAIVLIDYPGFNLRLAERVKPLGLPIIYYISPQIWAWAGGRIKQIKKVVDKMLVILPFEAELYERAGVPNEFVGHYLLDDIPPKLIKAPYDSQSKLILLMPGSRPQEVQRMLPTLIETASIIAGTGDYKFAVAAVEGNINYDEYIKYSKIPIDVVYGQTRELIAQSRLVVTSSGTATVETGIIGRPMVVIYKTGTITYLIARRLVKLNNIALINISAGERIVPELIQRDACPENIAGEAKKFLDNEPYCISVIDALNAAADRLNESGASARAAEAIMRCIADAAI
ncbi:MAG: lipid-A-disaccharide synthase [candidate division Zixibacteria bacterium HGW-Zixibacteria-1]|nr:MAG: lipid-A-disaccharide synthase [candidate division Zixibacteria bacterium HGW-Zixibacteria-1]